MGRKGRSGQARQSECPSSDADVAISTVANSTIMKDGYPARSAQVASVTETSAVDISLAPDASKESVHVESIKDALSCPLMGPDEVAAISVSFADVETRLNQVLHRHGVAIVTDVLNAQECQRLESLFTADLCDLLDMDAAKGAGKDVQDAAKHAAADVRDWQMASVHELGQMERCQLRGLPQGRFAWAGRLHPNVRRTYEVIHGTDNLVSSCDNSFFAPPAHPEQTATRNWPHVDHNKHDFSVYDEEGVPVSEWEVYQGLLYIWRGDISHASTTVVWCGSHQDVYEEMMADPGMQKRGSKGVHFCRIQDMKSEEIGQSLCQRWRRGARRVPMPAGALLLWSSKTLHQGWSGGPRLVQPVCWEPAWRRSEKSYERKLRLAALGLPSTHWASLGQPHTLVDVKPSAPSKACKTRSGIALPLKSTLQPATLAAGVNIQDMWRKFQKEDWEKPLPTDLKEFLMRSLKPEILDAL